MGSVEPTSFRQRLEIAWLRLVRAYTFNTPIDKGKYRIFLAAMRPCRSLPFETITDLRDGRRFAHRIGNALNESIFFLGEYERAVTQITRKLVHAGDLCIDVGANCGWYTTLFAAAGAEVHAFEPIPATFRDLKKNVEVNGVQKSVHLNNIGLVDRVGQLKFNFFAGLSPGHTSISDLGRDDATPVVCQIDTLSNYIDRHLVGRSVDLVKVDIEGAELSFLKGADRLFEQERPPIIQMEMALELTRNFDYFPDDLIKYIASKADYEFYAVDDVCGTLYKVDGFARELIGANVFCIPSRGFEDRIAAIQSFVK